MNFDDVDEVLDKLGPIEMWEEEDGKKKRTISHCRERFDLGVPTNWINRLLACFSTVGDPMAS